MADIIEDVPYLVVENSIFKRRFSIVEMLQVCKEYFIYPLILFLFFNVVSQFTEISQQINILMYYEIINYPLIYRQIR